MDFELSSALLLLFGVGLCTVTFLIIRSTSLLHSIILLSASSLLITLCYLLMDAPDVAMTEAALGACLSTSVLLGFLGRHCEEHSDKSVQQKMKSGLPRQLRFLAMTIIVALTTILLYCGLDLALYGDIATEAHMRINQYFLTNTGTEIGAPSFVAAILASYRGYDTLGETTVIFAAAMAVALSLPGANGEGATQFNKISSEAYSSPVLTIITKFIAPFIIFLGIYVQLNGEISPGGGFQAGAILASILIGLSFVSDKYRPSLNQLKILTTLGLLIYATTGLIPILLGARYLDYYILASNPHMAQQIGILIIELGVGLTVSAGMLLIYFLFDGAEV
jgi:multicomponent Na+:H+ antiporter subunit B